jgi:predicted GNAT family acetyltransferase
MSQIPPTLSGAAAKPAVAISAHPAQHRYEAHLDGELAGYVEYSLVGESILFSHTEVLPAFEGQGLGGTLARHVLADARAQGKQVIPVCQFVAGYIRKHREYVDLVSEASQRAFRI